MPIRYKLGLIAGGLSTIIVLMFVVTWFTTTAQKTDGLLINLAGRQRMLSQKMSKEIMMLSAPGKEKPGADSVKNTIQVFDITLQALLSSGKAPLSLDLSGAMADCPRAEEPAHAQLLKVQDLWRVFSRHMDQVISGAGEDQSSLEFITQKNLTLLKEMNTAVGMLQKISEKKVHNLILFQTICLVAGIFLMILSVVQIHGIVGQLLAAASNAVKMSKGDLTKRFNSGNKNGQNRKDRKSVV